MKSDDGSGSSCILDSATCKYVVSTLHRAPEVLCSLSRPCYTQIVWDFLSMPIKMGYQSLEIGVEFSGGG